MDRVLWASKCSPSAKTIEPAPSSAADRVPSFPACAPQVRAELSPTSASAVDVQFIEFKVGPIKIKAPKSAQGALDTTYLDEEVRVSRGDKGNLFVLVKAVGLEPEFS